MLSRRITRCSHLVKLEDRARKILIILQGIQIFKSFFFSRSLSFNKGKRSANGSNIFKIFGMNIEKVNIRNPGNGFFLFFGAAPAGNLRTIINISGNKPGVPLALGFSG